MTAALELHPPLEKLDPGRREAHYEQHGLAKV
jgi:hypothetical protein